MGNENPWHWHGAVEASQVAWLNKKRGRIQAWMGTAGQPRAMLPGMGIVQSS